MAEWKRVFLSWKTQIVFWVLVGFSCFFFYNDLQKGYDDVADASLYYSTYEEIIEEVRRVEPGEQMEYVQKREDETYRNILIGAAEDGKYDYVVYCSVREQLEAIEAYPLFVESIWEKYDAIGSISIFNENGTFSAKNMEKTMDDYEGMRGITLELTNGLPMETFVHERYSVYALLLYGIYLTVMFLQDHQQNLRSLIRTTPNGRRRLHGQRLGILAVGIAGMALVIAGLYWLICYVVMGCVPNEDVLVQAVSLFQQIPWKMTLGVMWVFLWIVAIVSAYAISLLTWTFLSAFRNIKSPVLLLGIIGIMEWLSYRYINLASKGSILRVCNLFTCFSKEEWTTKYFNISVLGFPITTQVLSLIFYVALGSCCILMGFTLLMKQKPMERTNWLDGWMDRLDDKISTLWTKAPVFMKECYKVLFPQKGVLLLVVFVVFLVNGWQEKIIYTSGLRALELRAYHKITGELSQEAFNYMDEVRLEAEEQEQKAIEAHLGLESGEMSVEEYYAIQNQMWDVPYREFLDEFEVQLNSLQSVKEDRGITPWVIDQESYDRLLGSGSERNRRENLMFGCFFIVFICSGIFAYETKSGMVSYTRTTLRGRRWLLVRKYVLAGGAIVLFWLGIYGVELVNHHLIFPLNNLVAPAQSVLLFLNCPFQISVGLALAGVYGMRLVLFLLVGTCMLLISKKSESQGGALVLGTVLFVLPSFVYYFLSL